MILPILNKAILLHLRFLFMFAEENIERMILLL